MKDEFLKVVKYMAEHGEVIKAYEYLRYPPAILEGQVDDYLGEVQQQLLDLKEIQDYGTLRGKFNGGFVDPQDVTKLVAFQHLRKLLLEKGCKNVVDVGCYTGWMGRELSKDGIAVHGIDIHPVVIQIAAFYATGTLAKFEYLPVQKLGAKYPKQFDGAILFDVLEHVFDPKLAIANVNRAVKGWVFINLPHPQGEHDSKANVSVKEHEHLHSFSEDKLEKVFGQLRNYKLELIENEGGNINWFISYEV